MSTVRASLLRMLGLLICLAIAGMLLGCSAGDRGAPGPSGPTGPPGAPGDAGLGYVSVRVLDVFGNPVSQGVTVKAHVKSYDNPPDYVARPAQAPEVTVTPLGVGDFQLALPPGTYDIWAQTTIPGATCYDSTQGVRIDYVVNYDNNPAVTLRAPSVVSANEYSSNGALSAGRNVISGSTTFAWWKFTTVANPTTRQTWVWTTLGGAGGPLVVMRAGWLKADNSFGSEGAAFNYTVNADRGAFLLATRLSAPLAGDVTTKVKIRIYGINGQPNVLADTSAVTLIQTLGELQAGSLH